MPDPESALEEPLVVRPTSETIIYAMFAKWIQSYRDLALLMNQWCNIGGLVMTDADDNGLVCPPKLAPVQVVIVPIWKSEEEKSQVLAVGGKVKEELARAGVRVELDSRDSLKPGAKYFEWEAKGVPLRLEIGPRDVAAGQVMTARRTGGKAPAKVEGLGAVVRNTLDEIQAALFQAAKD